MSASRNLRLPLAAGAIGVILGIGLSVALYLVFSPTPSENQELSDLGRHAASDVEEGVGEEVATQPDASSAPPADLSLDNLGEVSRLSSDFERIRSVYSMVAQLDKRRLLTLLEESANATGLFARSFSRLSFTG